MKEPTLVLTFVPTLINLLTLFEQQKGSELTEEEVLEIRDKAVCMTISSDMLEKLEKSRGYKDLDPKHCWEEWCALKNSFC